MDKPRILIVEDDSAIRDILKKFLTMHIECRILEAGSGRQALEFLEKGAFDLILLDIKMPGISGMDILKKTKEAYPETDIIVISGWDSQSVACEALEKGAFDYIPKSSSVTVIQDKVCEILKKRNKCFPKNPKTNIP
jgi:DNA-binding NtrC family response regulator